MNNFKINNTAELRNLYETARNFIIDVNGIAENQYNYSSELLVSVVNAFDELLKCSTIEEYQTVADMIDYYVEEADSSGGLGVPLPENFSVKRKVNSIIEEQLSEVIKTKLEENSI